MGAAKTITAGNYEEITASGITLVDFWAPWCGPCKMLTPVIEQLAAEYAGRAVIGKINCDEEQDLAQRFSIRSIPAIYIIKDGSIVEQFVGFRSKEDLAKALNAAGA